MLALAGHQVIDTTDVEEARLVGSRIFRNHQLTPAADHCGFRAVLRSAVVGGMTQEPAADAPPERHSDMTASGRPLGVVVETLARLRDLRAARPRPDLVTARPALDRVRELLDA